jgi:hypothetical protein
MVDFGEELAGLPEDQRPANVVFVVVTDGYENASREWTRDRVLQKVTEQTEKYGWNFLYLAAGQDAIAEGAKYGVPSHGSMTYDSALDSYAAASASVTRTRSGQFGGFTEAERTAVVRGR